MRAKILVSVVTYNRKELLKENIEALLNQSYKDFDIFIINNKSTDGTEQILDYYKAKVDKFDYITLDENVGGAGGFNYAIKEAIIRDYEYVWLMDDDTIPEQEALQSLINKKDILNDKFSYLASIVKWTDGNWCKTNIPLEKRLIKNKLNNVNNGLIEIIRSSFVSCFVNLKRSREYGLPIKEFFIYGDDAEYTGRISTYNPAFLDINSCVVHKMNKNESDSNETEKSRIPRMFYSYRNNFYIERKRGICRTIRFIIKYFYHLFKCLFFKNKYRFSKIFYMTKGMIRGIFFNPKIEYVDRVKEKNKEDYNV